MGEAAAGATESAEPVRGAGAASETDGEAGGEAGPNTVLNTEPRREPPAPPPPPAPGDAGKGNANADDESLVPGRDDENELLLWRTRSRSDGRALSLGRNPGCMHRVDKSSMAAANASSQLMLC